MALSQPCLEVEEDCKPQLNVEVVPGKGNKCFVANSVMKGISCSKNCEDVITGMEDWLDDKSQIPKHVDVDITGCRNHSDVGLAETEDSDATEYSSSFDGTADDNENCSGFSEGEVESRFFGDNDFESSFDAFGSVFQMRKKKLTNHWRNFIRPLMWRCKWMELRIKEIDSQVLNYSRELEAYDLGKNSGLDQITPDGFCSKSLPFSSPYNGKKAMKRRKRKRVEDTTDLTAYMLQHNFFSYLENKRSDPDRNSLADEFGNAVTTEQTADCNDKPGTDDWTSFEFRDSESSMEHVLWKIETLHSRVKKLRGQIDTVMSKNPAKFSSSENLTLLAPLDLQTISAHRPAFSTGNRDMISPEAMYASAQYITDYDIGDPVLPESVFSSFGEAISVPDIIESTVGLLSAADVTLHQPQFGDSCEDIVDNVLTLEEAAEGVGHATLRRIKSEQHFEEPDIMCGQEGVNPCAIPSPELQRDPATEVVAVANGGVVPQEQSSLKSVLASDVHFPIIKRKRGERKAGSVVWNRRCSGETDSQ